MAKGKWTRRLGRALRGVFRTLDKTADRLANQSTKQVRHGKLEWGQDSKGKPVHSGKVAYPTKPVTRHPVKWKAAHVHDDKERWRATFVCCATGGSVNVDFVTYPVPEHALDALAHKRRHDLYGVYSDNWELWALEMLGTLGGDGTPVNEGE